MMTDTTGMGARRCLLLSLRHLIEAGRLLGLGLYRLARHLFLNFPNCTWLVITAAIAVYSFVKVAEARTERDRYSYENARLIHQIDSIDSWR